MTITVQDDTGSEAAANSYVEVAYADTYFAEIGDATWSALTDANKEYALIKAFRYLDSAYSFVNSPLTTTQNSRFPRDEMYVDGTLISGIPTAIKQAQCEFALIASSTDLSVNPTYDDSGFSVASESVSVAVVSRSKTFANGGGSVIVRRSYPAIEFLLKGFTNNSGVTLTRI